MQLMNSRSAYGWLAIALHWISAVGVIWLYFLGDAVHEAHESGLGREAVRAALAFHVSIGALFFVFLAARLVSSAVQTRPDMEPDNRYLRLVALFTQRLWLIFIGIQIVTGPLTVWSGGHGIRIFDWAEIPTPFPERVSWLHEALETIHTLTPNLFWPLLVLHVAGIAKHLFLDRDRTLQRMLWVRQG